MTTATTEAPPSRDQLVQQASSNTTITRTLSSSSSSSSLSSSSTTDPASTTTTTATTTRTQTSRRHLGQPKLALTMLRLWCCTSFLLLLLLVVGSGYLVVVVPIADAFTTIPFRSSRSTASLSTNDDMNNNPQQRTPTQPRSRPTRETPITKQPPSTLASSSSGSSSSRRNRWGGRPLAAAETNDVADAAREETGTPERQEPMVFVSGYSQKSDLVEALKEAVRMAVGSLPSDERYAASRKSIDLGMVSVSSLYDGGIHQPATVVVPTVVDAVERAGWTLRQLIGSSAAGCIASASSQRPDQSCRPTEFEGVPSVCVTLANLPETKIRTFHVTGADVPDDYGRYPARDWKRAVGLTGIGEAKNIEDEAAEEQSPGGTTPPLSTNNSKPNFFLLPSPAFATELDNLVQGLATYFPGSQVVGAIASTVSSLSRAKLFCWRNAPGGGGSAQMSTLAANSCYSDGCVGVALEGDVAIAQMTAPGAKPVGGIYQILKGQDSTIQLIVLDEEATDALQDEEDEQEDEQEEEDEEEELDPRAKMQQFYAKARIPKPVLAEANFLMRTLSDDDQAFMRRQLLVGLEQGGSTGRTASELKRLAEGQGHRFTVHQVASGGMKDGSVTLPLGSVDIQPGTRLRFFVRESEFAKKEIDALWVGYKKRLLAQQFQTGTDPGNSDRTATDGGASAQKQFTPAACLLVPTLDRGNKFFLGKPGYESNAIARVLPGISCISGFFCNGIIGKMDVIDNAKTGLQGSASGYFLIGSRSGRPIYSPAAAKVREQERKDEEEAKAAAARAVAAEDEKRAQRAKFVATGDRAPRSEDGELVLKRREVHSGRAMTVSTVEWSVAEKTAQPSSTLEGYMWDKETEVDRFRERVPLANLVSQCRLATVDPTSPKPRDWIGPLKDAARTKGFVIVPECKRMEPTTGSLRRRYDVSKIVRDFTLAGVPVMSVNCDSVLFGGSLEDITKARQASSSAAIERMSEDGVVVPPILASDLLLYPYQLYKLSLAGADAVNLVAGALASKDLMYLTKIAASLNFQVLITVTSEVQLRAIASLPMGGFHGVILSNRELEDFSFDMTGEQALSLLKSDALRELRETRGGEDFPVLVEGRVGIIEHLDPSTGEMSASQYIKELNEAGATGAIVGGALATQSSENSEALKVLQETIV